MYCICHIAHFAKPKCDTIAEAYKTGNQGFSQYQEKPFYFLPKHTTCTKPLDSIRRRRKKNPYYKARPVFLQNWISAQWFGSQHQEYLLLGHHLLQAKKKFVSNPVNYITKFSSLSDMELYALWPHAINNYILTQLVSHCVSDRNSNQHCWRCRPQQQQLHRRKQQVGRWKDGDTSVQRGHRRQKSLHQVHQ